jgi:NADPH-dependent ferric siderophore reductase
MKIMPIFPGFSPKLQAVRPWNSGNITANSPTLTLYLLLIALSFTVFLYKVKHMNFIKRKALSVFESQLSKKGYVLAVRAWEPATFFEVDLHLPEVDMEKWDSVQHMKIKVADYTYRDYTPTMWDAETHTCTLCINSSQIGPGSSWVSSLKRGDTISYVGIGSTLHKPVPGKRLLCLGDSSSMGHFLALKQLAAGAAEIYGAISFNAESHLREFKDYFSTSLEPVKEKDWDYALVSWLERQELTDEMVYIAGHTPTAQQLRKHLRQREDFKGKIKLQGFWG